MARAGAIPGTDGWVERSAEVDRVVAALTSGDGGLVTMVPEVGGVEGMGVTALVAAALRRPEVAGHFTEGIGWVNAGGEGPEEWASEVIDVLGSLYGEEDQLLSRFDDIPDIHDEDAVSEALDEVIFKPGARLVVIDGVPNARLVVPLVSWVPGWTWLVTTAVADDLPEFGVTLPVGPMTSAQAVELLRRDLPELTEAAAARLAELTGGWPLALAMVHGAIAEQVGTGEPAGAVAARIAGRIAERVDLADPASRAALIGALVDHSVGRLRSVDPSAAERFLELGLFGADETVPLGVAAMMWSADGGMTRGRLDALIARLESLSLLRRRIDEANLVLVREAGARVREVLGPEGLTRARRALIDADMEQDPEDWLDLPGTSEWLLRRIAGLYADAGDMEGLREVVCDGLWLAGRIQRSGVEAAMADLARAGAGPAEALGRVLGGSAHVLESARHGIGVDVLATLAARLHAIPGRPAEFRRWLQADGRPWLESRWTPPGLPHPALLRTFRHGFVGLPDLAISGDGAWLAAAGDALVPRWGLDGVRPDSLLGHEAMVTSVASARDGSWLATASWDETVRLWEADGTPRAVLTGHPGGVEAVAIAPDGTWLAAAGDGFLWFWGADGTLHARVEEGDEYERIAISPDGTWLVTTGPGGVHLWNADGTHRATILEDDGAEAVVIAPSGEWLALIGDEDGVLLVNADGSRRALLDVSCGGRALAVAPGGDWLAVTDFDDNVVIVDLSGAVRARLHGHTAGIHALVVTPDSGRLASVSLDETVRIWDVDLALREAPAEPGGGRHTPYAVAVVPDGSYLATAGPDGVRLWNADASPRGQGPRAWAESVAVSPDGTFLLTGDGDGLILVLDADGSVRRTEAVHSDRPTAELPSAAIAPDAAWMAVAADDEVHVLTRDGEGSVVLGPYDDDVRAVAIGPDSTWVAVAAGREVRRWTRDGRPLGPGMEADQDVQALAVAPDGRYVAAGTTGGVVELFDVMEGERVARFGHDDQLTGVAFSPDGTRLATTAANGCLRVWHFGLRRSESGIVLDGALHGVAWFPDGSGLCVAGAAGLAGFTYHR
ncbi:WD40 repeat domain-containing protein [Nonomuraea sp. NPDC050680]|uniref:WD40 repeat domain-containing protein n=1 Tax=Nonomuraea sp. NPDC050680 TaxID=3154630 RepID=UPI0033F7C86A